MRQLHAAVTLRLMTTCRVLHKIPVGQTRRLMGTAALKDAQISQQLTQHVCTIIAIGGRASPEGVGPDIGIRIVSIAHTNATNSPGSQRPARLGAVLAAGTQRLPIPSAFAVNFPSCHVPGRSCAATATPPATPPTPPTLLQPLTFGTILIPEILLRTASWTSSKARGRCAIARGLLLMVF
jgi:hypothetical protein